MYITLGGDNTSVDIGEDTNSDIYGQVEAIIAAWGSESISDFSDGSDGWFTLPASASKGEQKYQLNQRIVSPAIANYAG